MRRPNVERKKILCYNVSAGLRSYTGAPMLEIVQLVFIVANTKE